MYEKWVESYALHIPRKQQLKPFLFHFSFKLKLIIFKSSNSFRDHSFQPSSSVPQQAPRTFWYQSRSHPSWVPCLQVADFLSLGSSFRSSTDFRESSEFLRDPKILRRARSEQGALYEFLRVPAKSSFTRLIMRTAPWRASTMSSTKSTESLKDSECEKGQ